MKIVKNEVTLVNMEIGKTFYMYCEGMIRQARILRIDINPKDSIKVNYTLSVACIGKVTLKQTVTDEIYKKYPFKPYQLVDDLIESKNEIGFSPIPLASILKKCGFNVAMDVYSNMNNNGLYKYGTYLYYWNGYRTVCQFFGVSEFTYSLTELSWIANVSEDIKTQYGIKGNLYLSKDACDRNNKVQIAMF